MDEILTDLMNFAMNHGIGFTATKDLNPYTASAVDTKTRQIVLNLNWHDKKQLVFQFAHELGHIINGDHSDQILYFTPGKFGIELEANKAAVDLIAPYYLNDRELEQINPVEFMKIYAIPSHLFETVKYELIKCYYAK